MAWVNEPARSAKSGPGLRQVCMREGYGHFCGLSDRRLRPDRVPLAVGACIFLILRVLFIGVGVHGRRQLGCGHSDGGGPHYTWCAQRGQRVCGRRLLGVLSVAPPASWSGATMIGSSSLSGGGLHYSVCERRVRKVGGRRRLGLLSVAAACTTGANGANIVDKLGDDGWDQFSQSRRPALQRCEQRGASSIRLW